jgi:hypothetical protein
MIYLTGYGSLGLILAILFSTRVAPIIGVLFYGRREVLPVAPGRIVHSQM